ncbi:hypothetical protein EX30DRAFT_337997 [Ascodesmis nigricans]|uniref:SP-RING-type domain-containing protein n=1 Tax=Ascodesmis nigricans TaxID=341454 RepID=A0A4S2N8J9_9PEZI|nr:hypothetical protein EX30DRAFT_337997 [Ascodesmis nigricans]
MSSQQSKTYLPAYEPPILPLITASVDQLKANKLRSPSEFLKDSFQVLSAAAAELGSIEDSLTAKESEQDKQHKAPLSAPEAKAARAELLESIEAAVRKACDAAAKIEFQISTVDSIRKDEAPKSARADGVRRTRNVRSLREQLNEQEEEQHDDEEEQPCQIEESIWHRYKSGYKKEVEEYDALTDKEKYGQSKDYLNYRQQLWEAQYPNKPLPKDSFWFSGTANAESDSDDGLEIANEVREYKCPLSLQPFVDPMTSRKCPKHSFSKASIKDYFTTSNRGVARNAWSVNCPVAGCTNTLVWEDLYEDPGLLRRAQRAKEREDRMRRERAARMHDDDDDDDDEEEEEEEKEEEEGGGKDSDGDERMLDEPTQKQIKKEKTGQSKRKLARRGNRTLDLDSDDEMED